MGNDGATGNPADLSLTLGSGGVLVTGGTIGTPATDTLNATRLVMAPINVPVLTTAPSATGTEAIFQVGQFDTLNLGAPGALAGYGGGVLVGTLATNQVTGVATTFYENATAPVASVAISGFTKGLSGNLDIDSRQFYTVAIAAGATTLNGGTTVLNGGNNTLFDNGGALTVNAGATLDLNGTTELVLALSSGNGAGTSSNGVNLSGGTVTSNNGAALLVSNGATSTWAGAITGGTVASGNAVTFARVGGNTLTVYNANPYYGATYFYGSTVTIQDNGSLPNTSAIFLNNAVFTINNESDLFINNNNRVNPAAPITMNASQVQFIGLDDAYSTANFGALTVQAGANVITAGTGATGVYANADLIFASINRSISSPAVIENGAVGNTTTITGLGHDQWPVRWADCRGQQHPRGRHDCVH